MGIHVGPSTTAESESLVQKALNEELGGTEHQDESGRQNHILAALIKYLLRSKIVCTRLLERG